MPYIKSHSNYVLKRKHQSTNDGVIYERDITTIGGRNQFAQGQTPIYRSGNFVITINTDSTEYKKPTITDWERNDSGDTWTLETLQNYQDDSVSSDDASITVKKDYRDLRDFAYYGSCAELIRGSLNGILSSFPGELYVPNDETSWILTHEDVHMYVRYNVNKVNGKAIHVNGRPIYQEVSKYPLGNLSNGNTIYFYSTLNKSCQELNLKNEDVIGNGNYLPMPSEFQNGFYAGNVKVEIAKYKEIASNPLLIRDSATRKITHRVYYLCSYPSGTQNITYVDDCNCLRSGTTAVSGANYKVVESVTQNDNGTITVNQVSYYWQLNERKYTAVRNSKNDFTVTGEGEYGYDETNYQLFEYKRYANGRSDVYSSKSDAQEAQSIYGGTITEYKGGIPLYYTSYFDETAGSVRIGGDDMVLMDNPFMVDLHSRYMPNGENPLKFFAGGGNKNYVAYKKSNGEWDFSKEYGVEVASILFDGLGEKETGTQSNTDANGWPSDCISSLSFNLSIESNEAQEITQSEDADTRLCAGKYIGYFILNFIDNNSVIDTLKVYMYLDDTKTIRYMVRNTDKSAFSYRIRPKKEFIEKFFNELDSFSKVLLDRKSSPKYTARFEIYNEGDYGYYTTTQSFTFPTTYGGYNLGSDGVAYEEYLNSLVKVSSLYDEVFSDNIYRSMTHEAIKNFDWTYNRYSDGDDKEKYEEGNETIKNMLRLWGREFDEIKGFVDGITCMNVVTYDNVSNLPTYFFTDKLEDEGWDISSILPVKLTERKGGYDGEIISWESEDLQAECEKKNMIDDVKISRTFAQIPNGEDYSVKPYESPSERLKTSEREFVSHVSYTPSDVNSEFMKRLILNSRSLWRHKGTIHGIEMLLGMFGMKSKRFAEMTEADSYDYDISEYTLFTTRIEDEWSNILNSYKIDYVNSTKLISYDTDDYREGIYIPYQGITVAYRDKVDENGENHRYLYPHFGQGMIYDGNPYYQMRGGWMAKRPFMFDTHNNIVARDSEDETSTRRDNELFTETARTVKCVETLQDMLSSTTIAQHDGDICQVLDLSGRYAVVDGMVYNLYTEYPDNGNDQGFSYFYVPIRNKTLSVGNAFFSDYVVVSNPYCENQKQRVNLADGEYNDIDLKVYVLTRDDGSYYANIYASNMSISTFTVFENGKYMKGDNFTNYFRINNVMMSNELSVMGWQQLRDDEYEYYRLSTLTDKKTGNNPHLGHMSYDNGHEYFLYFKNLFKYAIDNDLFDERQISEDTEELVDLAESVGFKNLVKDDACDTDYDEYLVKDSKCHYFGDIITDDESGDGKNFVNIYGNVEIINGFKKPKKTNCVVKKYSIDKKEGEKTYNLLDMNPIEYDDSAKYGDGVEDGDKDGVTNQIVNCKRIDITFNLRSKKEYTTEWLEEVKYIDSVILPYLEQMMPSGAICRVQYV